MHAGHPVVVSTVACCGRLGGGPAHDGGFHPARLRPRTDRVYADTPHFVSPIDSTRKRRAPSSMIACTRFAGHGLHVSSGAALLLGTGAVFPLGPNWRIRDCTNPPAWCPTCGTALIAFRLHAQCVARSSPGNSAGQIACDRPCKVGTRVLFAAAMLTGGAVTSDSNPMLPSLHALPRSGLVQSPLFPPKSVVGSGVGYGQNCTP